MSIHRWSACAAWTALLLVSAALVAQPVSSAAALVIVVETVYSGANAAIVADTVAAPIEQQLRGLDGVVRLVSRCGDDGTYRLWIVCRAGADLDQAKSTVQQRLALAQPALPESARRHGVTLAAKLPIRAIVCLTAPADRHDPALISGMASNQIKTELARIPGVGGVTVFGAAEPRVRIWLDPDRLRALDLSAIDVVHVLEKEAGAAASPKASDPLERLRTTDALGQIVLKSENTGTVVRLNDVARVELGVNSREHATFNGQPCVALLVNASSAGDPKELTRRLTDQTDRFRASLPEGLTLTARWELSSAPASDTSVLIDVVLPQFASVERGRDALVRCERLLREVNGVADVLALTANPFDLDRQPSCLLVRLAANSSAVRDRQLIRQVRALLGQDAGIALRLRDRSPHGALAQFAYPIDLAISGPDIQEARELAEQFAQRLRDSQKLTDVAVNLDSQLRTRLDVAIDRTRAAALGLKPQEIADAVELHTGSLAVGATDRAGPRWYVSVPSDGQLRSPADGIKQIQLRNAQGQMVPLGTVVALRTIAAPAAIHRLDGKPMVRVTANPAADETPTAAWALCELTLDQLLKEPGRPAGYRLTWLNGRDEK